MNDAVNERIQLQIGHEFEAALTYLSMAGWFESQSLPGFAAWMREQSKEEVEHGMKLFEFLVDRGTAPQLPAIPAPANTFNGAVEVFEAAFAHEQKVTSQIHELYEQSVEARDYQAQILLQWFITEQLEEEKNTGGMVERLKMVEGSRAALLILDSELGARTGDPHPA